MIIAVDIDQVLADTLKTYLPFNNRRHGTDISVDDCYSIEWWKVFGITEQQFINDFYDFNDSGLIMAVKPLSGAAEIIDILTGKHRLIAVTARSADIADGTERWLEEYFPGKFSHIFYTRKNIMGKEKESKYEICLHNGADILIDDSFENAETCAVNGLRVLLYDWPWNRKIKLPMFIDRVHGWPEIWEKVKIMELNRRG
jgi:uncharacterized HAD superfamily protein